MLLQQLTAGRTRGEVRELNFTQLGGAYNRTPADATAFAHRAERYMIEHVLAVDPDTPEEKRDWHQRSWATAHRCGSGRVYPNFRDPDFADAARAYHGENHERLVRIKRAYDPERVFRFPQSLWV